MEKAREITQNTKTVTLAWGGEAVAAVTHTIIVLSVQFIFLFLTSTGLGAHHERRIERPILRVCEHELPVVA